MFVTRDIYSDLHEALVSCIDQKENNRGICCYFECAVLVIWHPVLPWLQACSSWQAPLWAGALKAELQCSREEEGGNWELYHSNFLTKSTFFSELQTAALIKDIYTYKNDEIIFKCGQTRLSHT